MRILLGLLLLLAHRPGAAQVNILPRKAALEEHRTRVERDTITPIAVKIPAVVVFRVESLIGSKYDNRPVIRCYGHAWQLDAPQYYLYLNNVFLPDEAYIRYLHARLSRQEIISRINERIVRVRHITGQELAGKYPALPQGVWLIKARARRLTRGIRKSNRNLRQQYLNHHPGRGFIGFLFPPYP